MDPWWWVPISLAAWFLVALAIALCLGPVLKRSSQAREALDQESEEPSDETLEPPGAEEPGFPRKPWRFPPSGVA
jgi:hypothetical protein